MKHIEDLVDNLGHERFPNIAKYIIKGTKNPNSITKKIRSMESNSQGMEGSIIPFSKFGSIQSKLFPSNDMGDSSALAINLAADHINNNINKPLRRKVPSHRRRRRRKI